MENAPAKTRILVVDDDRDTVESLAVFLELLDYDVCVAHDGLEALALAGGYRPHVVVMDINMPGLDGLHTARRLRADRRLERVTFIAHTSSDDTFMRRMAAQIGFDHFVRKGEVTALTKIVAASAVDKGGRTGLPR
jgi:CheY-like chemotaxis protein